MDIIEDNLDIALEIINTLIQSKTISNKENSALYQSYAYNSDIENLTNKVAEKMGFNIYRKDEELNLCVMLNNKVFGYTNEELKNKLKRIYKNEDLYLMYFVILVLIVCFYKESGMSSPRSYLGLDELIETINIKLENLPKDEIEKISKEREYNFRDIKMVWDRLPDGREDVSIGKNDKISFAKLVLQFLQDEKLIVFNEERQIITLTNRFQAIVYFYFENSKENKNQLLEFVYNLGGE